LKKFIKIVLTILILALVINWIDFKHFQESIKGAKLIYIITALFIITLNRIIMALKWELLLNEKKIENSVLRITGIYYIANFLGFFLPPTIGADAVRAYYVARNKNQVPDVLATIVIERILGFICLFISALAGFLLFRFWFSQNNGNVTRLILPLFILSILGIALFYFSFSAAFKKISLKIISKTERIKFIAKAGNVIHKFIDSYQSFKNHKTTVILFTVFTFLEIFTVVLWAYYIGLSLNVHVSLLYFLAFIPIVLLFTRLPVTIDGFGINEGLYVYFLAFAGVNESVAFTIGFLNHIITIIGILPGGIFYLLIPKEKINKAELLHENIIQR